MCLNEMEHISLLFSNHHLKTSIVEASVHKQPLHGNGMETGKNSFFSLHSATIFNNL